MNPNILMTRFPLWTLIMATSAIHSQDSDIADIRKQFTEIHSHLKSFQINKTEISCESAEVRTPVTIQSVVFNQKAMK